MSDGTSTDILEVRDNFRVRLVRDENAEKPYNEGSTPILEFPYRSTQPTFMHEMGAYIDRSEQIHIEEAGRRFRYNTDLFERYLRMFYGVTTIKWYESQESRYVTFDTADWRKHHDLDTPIVNAPEYRNSINLDEWRAYVEGDVYGYILEERNNWLRVSPLNASNGHTPDMMETWEEVESTWGFYGLDYAKEAALEALTEVVSDRNTTPTEHTTYTYPL